MTRAKVIRVVVCGGGLGIRIAGWARDIPKEFYPVEGRPGIVHLLEEISVLGPAEVVIVCHPYYDAFTTWARAALSPDGHDSYLHAARLPAAASPTAGFTVSGPNALLALQAAPPSYPVVLARANQRELATSRGVIATRRQKGQLFMIDLAERLPAKHSGNSPKLVKMRG